MTSNAIKNAGEVTLTGRILPIGGLKEKTLAARRSGITTLIFPGGNRKDWEELSGPTPQYLIAWSLECQADRPPL